MNDLDIKKFTQILIRLFVFFVACLIAYNLLKPAEYVVINTAYILNKKTGAVFFTRDKLQRSQKAHTPSVVAKQKYDIPEGFEVMHIPPEAKQ